MLKIFSANEIQVKRCKMRNRVFWTNIWKGFNLKRNKIFHCVCWLVWFCKRSKKIHTWWRLPPQTCCQHHYLCVLTLKIDSKVSKWLPGILVFMKISLFDEERMVLLFKSLERLFANCKPLFTSIIAGDLGNPRNYLY